MKNKLVVLFLLLLVLCTSLLACDTTEGGGEETTGEPVTEEPLLTMLEENGDSRYMVIFESDNDNMQSAAAILRNTLQTTLGCGFVTLTEDAERDPASEEIAQRYEILVGDTNRPETAQVKQTLAAETWTIQTIGHKIVLLGADDAGTRLAIEAFITQYLGESPRVPATILQTGTAPEPWTPAEPPKDSSRGKTNPQLVQTLYETEDVVIADIVPNTMGYAVDPTGKADSTAGIQKALDDCAAAGGGTVFLPAGNYVVTKLIKIPTFVTLRGDWQDPDLGKEGYGTVIHVRTPSSDKGEAGLFLLGGSGGVIGLTVYYPEQSAIMPVPYPFAFYTKGQGNDYMLSTVKNVTVINGYRGIGACVAEGNAHEQLTVDNFKGTFLYTAAEVYNQADVGTWKNVTVSGSYWKNAKGEGMQAANAAVLDSYLKANVTALMLGDLEWTEFGSLKIEGYHTGIEIVQGKRIQFAGSLYDVTITDCKKGVVVKDLDSRWGMLIARSTIEGGISNSTGGMVKLCGVQVSGKCTGTVEIDESDLSAFAVDFERTYVKPASQFYLAKLTTGIRTDVSAALQAILDKAGQTGGVVYLPAGTYRLDQPITVPAGVELRGASSVPTRDAGGMCGATAIVSYYGIGANVDPDADPALITLNGKNAGLNGIRIFYPENGPYSANRKTTYTVRGKGEGVYFVNGSIVASGYGVDFRGCDRHYIEKVTACCYFNTFLLGGEGGMLTGCLQNGTVITRCAVGGKKNWLTEDKIFSDLFDPILRRTANYIIVDGAKNQVIANTFCYGCANMLTNRNSTGTLAVNIGSDNIGSTQTVMTSGSMTVINAMRYNGVSYTHGSGALALYNRLTITDKSEITYQQNR